jgi:cytochrome P450
VTTTDTRPTPIPRPRGVTATISAARGLTGDPCPTLDALSSELGATFEVPAGPMRIVVVGDPAHLTELYAAPTDAFLWGHRLNVLRFFVGDSSIIVSDGDDHRRRRGIVQPGFARRRLDGWVPRIVDEADRTIDETIAPSEGVIDLFPVGRRLVLRVVVNALFGTGFRAHADEIDGLIDPAKVYLEQSLIRQLPHPLPFTRRARARDARARFDRLIDDQIARRRAEARPDSGDVLDLLLASDGLSDSEIRDQVVTLIAAGYDTTASSIAWTLTRAVRAPGVWDRLRAEADAAFGAVGVVESGPATMQQLPYAKAVVREALRLHPAGVFSPRQVTRDVAIGPHILRKGAFLLLCPYLAGRDAGAWHEPLRFDPERHLSADGAAVLPVNPAWVPFGRGPRHCIGFALAEMELVLILARFAQRLDIDLASKSVPVPYGMVVNRPSGGVRAMARLRSP